MRFKAIQRPFSRNAESSKRNADAPHEHGEKSRRRAPVRSLPPDQQCCEAAVNGMAGDVSPLINQIPVRVAI